MGRRTFPKRGDRAQWYKRVKRKNGTERIKGKGGWVEEAMEKGQLTLTPFWKALWKLTTMEVP